MEMTVSRGWLRATGARVFHRFVENPAVFYYARTHFYWGTRGPLRRALELRPGERLLDIGCGAGMGAGMTRGMYVGVDMVLTYLRFARARLRDRTTHSFLAMSALELGFRDAAFDKAMLLNVLHHLDDGMVDRFLTGIARVVRDRIVILDHDPERNNAIGDWLARHDRGAFVRRCDDLTRLLERRCAVERVERFHNTEHTVAYALFVLRVRPPAAASAA